MNNGVVITLALICVSAMYFSTRNRKRKRRLAQRSSQKGAPISPPKLKPEGGVQPYMWFMMIAVFAHRWFKNHINSSTSTNATNGLTTSGSGSWSESIPNVNETPSFFGALRDLIVDPVIDKMIHKLAKSSDGLTPQMSLAMMQEKGHQPQKRKTTTASRQQFPSNQRSASQPNLSRVADDMESQYVVMDSSATRTSDDKESVDFVPDYDVRYNRNENEDHVYDPRHSLAPPIAEPYIDGKRTSRGEEECRAVLEETLGVHFPSVRPLWLKNPVTGVPLELDCYNSEYGIAVEYHGEQHYKHVPKFHPRPDQFRDQQYRDQIKRMMCSQQGIKLIEVPYTVPLTGIRQFLLEKLKECGALVNT